MAEPAPALALSYEQPDYTSVFAARSRMLLKLRSDKDLLKAAKVHYKANAWDFINDWGMTFDPRAVDEGRIAHMPFVLWPRQVEYIKWLDFMLHGGRNGQCEKSRDCGVSWMSTAWGVTHWLFDEGFVCGYGSRKEELVDDNTNPKSLFWMIRYFLNRIPYEFMPAGFEKRLHSAKMRLTNPENGSALVGEAGDQIGRGGRTSAYIVDEYAFIANQSSVDAALSATTNTQIDISTFNGAGNRFFLKNQKLKGTPYLFVFDLKDDPRKTPEWEEKVREDPLFDEVIFAQEYGRDPYASQTDSFINAKWVLAAIDAHEKLGFHGSGIRAAGFDPADIGDAKGFVYRHGSVVEEVVELRDGDITYAIPWAVQMAESLGAEVLGYEADGMGAPTMKMALNTESSMRLRVEAWHGSDAVDDPDGVYLKADHPLQKDKTNQDAYVNRKAQDMDRLAKRFKNTWVAIERQKKGLLVNFNVDDLISLSSKCQHIEQLRAELSSPKRLYNDNGKIQVESKKKLKARGIKSPNLLEALVVAFSRKKPEPQRKRPVRGKTRRLRDPGMGY